MSAVRVRSAAIALVALACVAAAQAGSAAWAAQAGTLGFARFEVQTTQGGQPPGYENEPYDFNQAGGHPFALTTSVEFAGVAGKPVSDPKDVLIGLPPGLSANPQAVPICTASEGTPCPISAQVGVFVLRAHVNGATLSLLGPLVNLAHGPGEAARLGLETPFGRFLLSGRLTRGPQGYGLAIVARGLPALGILEMQTTLWGVPAAAAHDGERGLSCLRSESSALWSCSGSGRWRAERDRTGAVLDAAERMFERRRDLTAWVDSWQQPRDYAQASAALRPMSGCDRLPFGAEVTLRPDSWQAEAPVALDLEIGLEQSNAPMGIAAAQLRGASVTLPAGMTIDPSAAAGAQACPSGGPEGIGIPTGLSGAGRTA